MSPQKSVGADHEHQGGAQKDGEGGDIAEEIHSDLSEYNALTVAGNSPDCYADYAVGPLRTG